MSQANYMELELLAAHGSWNSSNHVMEKLLSKTIHCIYSSTRISKSLGLAWVRTLLHPQLLPPVL